MWTHVDLGRKISAVSGDDRDSTSLPAHLSFNPATQLHSAPSQLLRRMMTFRVQHFLSV